MEMIRKPYTSDYCQDLLTGAITALRASTGAILAVEESALGLMAGEHGCCEEHSRLVDRLAKQVLGSSRPTTTDVEKPAGCPLLGINRGWFAAPLLLDDEIVGVLVIGAVDDATETVDTLYRKVSELVTPMALAVARARVQRVLENRGDEVSALRRQLDAYAIDLRLSYRAEKDRAAELTKALAELEETYRATVHTLAVAVEAKDECTGGHLQRVTRYGMMLTRLAAPDHWGDPQFEYGFLLHDVGKLTVPDVILTKPGALTQAEWEEMRLHPTSGASILEGIPFLAGAREIVFAHHEQYDGSGYPRGLRGEEIPLGALIFPLCDAFDAMTSNRPYRRALPIKEALLEIKRGRGTQFWPDAVDAFLTFPHDALEVVATSEGSP
jgi:HD-GYP domain-containing protein (c-di-GMP phosphodiesterase class II)